MNLYQSRKITDTLPFSLVKFERWDMVTLVNE
jgi:hypothetical protein